MEKIFEIPEITDNTIKYFVDGEFVGDVSVDQVNRIRENVIEHIIKNKGRSILGRFYFIGHRDSNDKPGEEVKITMDVWGNFSDLPWEMNHVRRSMMRLMHAGRVNSELLHSLESQLTEYPERLYIVWHNGCIEENTLDLSESGKTEERRNRSYEIKILTNLSEWDGDGNRVFQLKKAGARTSIKMSHEFSIDYIEKCLKGDHDTFWTTDIDKAVKAAKENFRNTWPTGRIWKVVTYFDDKDDGVYRDGLSNREAVMLKNELDSKNTGRPYWSCSVKHD